MSAIMTSRQAAELDHAFERNGYTAEDVKRLSAGDMLARVLPVVRGRAKIVVKSILDFVTSVRVPAQGRFVARDHFMVDTSDEAEVKIGYLGANFQTWFLGKIEEPVGEAELAIHTLTEPALDAPILEELGERAETTLSQFWALLKAQGRGEVGPLLTNGYANIAYIHDSEGTLRAVRARWDAADGAWRVHADSVEHPIGWRASRQVVSRK